MLATVLKTNSSCLHAAFKAFSSWPVKDVNVACRFRYYHRGIQLIFPLKRDLILQTTGSPLKYTKYSYATAIKSEIVENAESQISASPHSVKSHESADDFYKRYAITIRGKDVPPPILSIEEANFPGYITDILKKQNLTKPTPIQSVAWSVVLEKRDFVGISPTGSGKTLAFGIPSVLRAKELKSLYKSSDIPSPFVLILAPTRELAQQIEDVMKWFQDRSFRCLAVYGGVRKQLQVPALQQGVDILISTPGRCYDLLESQIISLERCPFLVLDEADRMLDMGFLPQIEPIIEHLPSDRQSLMWTATWPEEVREVALKFLKNYIQISIGTVELTPNRNVKQTVVMCSNRNEKLEKFLEFLSLAMKSDNPKILVFAEQKFNVDNLVQIMTSKGIRVKGIHGGKGQRIRDHTLNGFRRGQPPILVATAVAARGLDIDNITHVVNFDCPKNSDEYIHKIGRTGRMEKKGESITYVTDEDIYAGYLVQMLRFGGEEVPDELLRFDKGAKFIRSAYSNSGFPRNYQRFRGRKWK